VSGDGPGTRRARPLLAPNPSPATLEGTNTWLICEPGSAEVAVVDPGPDHPGHLRRVLGEVSAAGQRVGAVLLTHAHPDHAAGAARFARLAGAPVLAADPAFQQPPGSSLSPGATLTAGGCELRVLATPGHSPDSVCLHLPADRALLTGDTVLGRGTTVIAKDGSLADYLDSLRRLRALADEAGLAVLLPGHGPAVTGPAAALDYYLAHREERLAQVTAAVAAGARTPAEIVARVYTGLDPALRRLAELSARAQLEYLRAQGRLPSA
jgi:glyoxylase-like metal-dependent hydrolase (beta-lactamase superfamily II)